MTKNDLISEYSNMTTKIMQHEHLAGETLLHEDITLNTEL
jgi:hypothetical protein